MKDTLKSTLLRYGVPFAAGLAIGLLAMAPRSHTPTPVDDGGGGTETPTNLDELIGEIDRMSPSFKSPAEPNPATAIAKAVFVDSDGSSFRPRLEFKLNGRLAAGATPRNAAWNLLPKTTVKGPDGTVVPFGVSDDNWEKDTLALVAASDCSNGIYTVEVQEGVDLGEGLSLGEPFKTEVSFQPEEFHPIYLSAGIDSFSGRGTLNLRLNRKLPPEELAKILEIDPPVQKLTLKTVGYWEYSSFDLWKQEPSMRRWDGYAYGLSGTFETGKEYSLRLLGSAPGESARYRIDSTPIQFRLPKPPPAIEFQTRGTALATVGRRGVAIRSREIPEIRMTLSRILPQNMPEFLHRSSIGAEGMSTSGLKGDDDDSYWYDDRDRKVLAKDLSDPVGVRSIAIGRSPICDAVTTNIVALDDFASDERLPSGVYLLDCSGYDPDQDETLGAVCRRIVALSDIGLTVRRIGKSVHVWVSRLSKAGPVSGATLELYAQNNKLLATARTDAAGLGELALGNDNPSFVLAKTDSGEYAYITLDADFALDELPNRPSEEYPTDAKTLSAFLFTDRGIYRHGEPVLLQGLVRNATGTAPEPTPLSVELVRPDGRIVDTISVKTDANGFFALSADKPWSAPDGQPSGTWSARLRTPGKNGTKLASRPFSVEEFVPPQIKVETLDFPAVLPVWRTIELCAKADYFFGSPATGLKTEASFLFEFEPFRPEGYAQNNWHFGSGEEDYCPQLVGCDGMTGTNGVVRLSLPFSPKIGNSSESVRVDVETSVVEPGGRPVVDHATAVIHPWQAYLGLEGSSAEPGSDFRVRLRLVAPDGSVVTNSVQDLKATLCAMEHHYEYSRNDRGWWDWNDRISEKELETFSFDLEGGETNLVFALPSFAGEYRISVTPPDSLTELPPAGGNFDGMEIFRVAPVQWTFGAWGRNGKKEALAGPVRLKVMPNAKEYKPGDVAHLEVRAPFEGLALVTVQRDRVVGQSLVTLTNGLGTVDVPVTASLAPNFEVAVSCIRPVQPEATWGEHRAFGAVSIRVKDPARTLPIQVAEPRVEIRPVGSRVTVDVSGGTPGAHASVFLVDEAVLDLTEYKTPVPDWVFSQAYWSGAELFDTYRALMRIEQGPYAKSAAIGGGGGAALRRRTSPIKSRRFQPLALAKTDLAFENGTIRAVFDLPEFSGRVRAFAVAWTDRATGSAEASAKVAPKVVLQPDAARFLAPGDESELSGVLHNTTDQSIDLVWTCSLGGGDVATPISGAPIAGSLTLPAGASHTIRIPIRVSKAPSATELPVEFKIQSAEETRSAKLRIPVRPAFPLRPVTGIHSLESGATLTLEPPATLEAGSLETQLTADPSPFSKYGPAIRWLNAYPWGCLEQTTSRALPLLYAQKANAEMSGLSPQALDDRILRSIAIIAARMGYGAFFVWDDSFWTDPDYSAYAGFFLAEAEAAGYAMPSGLKTGYRHILRTVAGDVTLSYETRALAALALENAGSPVRDWEQNLFDRRAKFSALAAYRLSMALRKAGQPDQAKELLLAAKPKTDTLDCAWGILAWLASGLPETQERVTVLEGMLHSVRGDEPHWGSTTENAAALLASAALIRRSGSIDGKTAHIVLLDDGKSFLDATGTVARATTDLQRAFTVSNAGPSRIFLDVVASGLPLPDSVHAATHGVSITRTYRTRDGEPIDPTAGIPVGETVIAELRIVPEGGDKIRLDNLVVEELFPAGLEPRIGADIPACNWIDGKAHDWVGHAEVRDDRLVLFAESIEGPRSYFYTLSAVSAGSYVLPPAQVDCMYKPSINGISEPGSLRVLPRP